MSDLTRSGVGRDVATTFPHAPPPMLGRTLAIVVAVGLSIHIIGLLLGKFVWPDWRWTQYPVHTAVEITGCLIALWVSWTLLSLDKLGTGTSFNIWIAGAIVGMGTLDGIHALLPAGNTFVWLHSVATLVGGLLFFLLWFQRPGNRQVKRWWPGAVFVGTLAIGVWSIFFPELTPRMVVSGADGELAFGTVAKVLNLGGGALLLAAGGRLALVFAKQRNVDDLLFGLHCALFGAAAVMFEQSELWDVPWWTWHLLRLQAYGVALWFIVGTEMREQKEVIRTASDLKQLSVTLGETIEQMTLELREKNLTLEQSNMELQQFAYVASHDLQAPLRGISGFAQLLQRHYHGRLDERADEWINNTVRGTQRMQNLIQDLLTFSSVESRSTPFEAVNLKDVVDEAVEQLASSIRDNGGHIECGDLPTVPGDRSQLVHLFQNLIGNGIKYHGDDIPRVCLTSESVNDDWVIAVTDNGIGIDPKFHERVFEIFRRLHTERAYPGTGIGLAVCRRIVQRHHGRIWVESEVGRGSTFRFTLPKEEWKVPTA